MRLAFRKYQKHKTEARQEQGGGKVGAMRAQGRDKMGSAASNGGFVGTKMRKQHMTRSAPLPPETKLLAGPKQFSKIAGGRS